MRGGRVKLADRHERVERIGLELHGEFRDGVVFHCVIIIR